VSPGTPTAHAGHDPPPPRRRVHLRTLVALCILIPVAVAGFLGARDAARRDAAAARGHRADEATAALQATLARSAADVHALAGVFSTAREVDAFAQFAAPGRRSDALVALAWAPTVPPSMRRSFEQSAGFPIATLGPGGVPVPASRQGEVFPVLYITPGPENARLVGIDLAGIAAVQDALARVIGRGNEQVTAPFDLPQGGRGIAIVEGAYQRGAATASPAERRAALNGYTVGLYRLDGLGAAAFHALSGLGISVGDDGSALYRTGDAAGGTARTVDFGGRRWTLVVASATDTSRAALPWVVLLGGLLIALLIASMVEQNAQRLAFSEHLVWIRTNELRDALGQLTEANVELEAARAEAERASQVDALTGTYNRPHLLDLVTTELNRAARGGTTPAILLLEIDDHALLESEHGPVAADAVLVEVAARIRGVLRSYDSLGRWSTAQFGVLAPNVPDDEALWRVADTIRSVVGAAPTVVLDGLELWATVSVGAVLGTGGREAFQLVAAADAALADARRRGHDQTVLVDGGAGDGAPDAMRIAHALAVSVSQREGVPPTHDRDVAALAAAIATTMGLDADTVERARLAGLLHDVGKVAIPRELLTRQGPLGESEWSIMRTHSALGEEIVRRIPALEPAARGVRHHHERFDGTGYPDALAGVAIPVEARIVAVADAYWAMTAGPSFRRPRSVSAALAEITAGADTQFDAVVVQALADALAGSRAA
jgi:diguanylate cyclase (GGDEF)-like protein/putative nucleotidyltransferase with HDIG domain